MTDTTAALCSELLQALQGSQPTSATTPQWVATKDMLRILSISRTTLMLLKRRDILKSNRHYRKVNPLSARSNLLWHVARTLNTLNAY